MRGWKPTKRIENKQREVLHWRGGEGGGNATEKTEAARDPSLFPMTTEQSMSTQ